MNQEVWDRLEGNPNIVMRKSCLIGINVVQLSKTKHSTYHLLSPLTNVSTRNDDHLQEQINSCKLVWIIYDENNWFGVCVNNVLFPDRKG